MKIRTIRGKQHNKIEEENRKACKGRNMQNK